MVRVVDPRIGKTVYDPGCATGGFLAQSFEYMRGRAGNSITSVELDTLKYRTFYGREKDNVVYPIGLANLVLHGIDEPHIWHGNSLSDQATYAGLFSGAPAFFDYVLMNPPFGGKEGKEAQTAYEYKTNATQVLFIQNVLKSMKTGSRCGIVLDEGVLFRVDADAFVQTKRKMLEECNVYCIVSLPGGVFSGAGAGVKTNLVFFDKGPATERIWYYDLSDIKVGKKTPLTLPHFEEFSRLLPERADSERSWTVDFAKKLEAALEEARPHREQAISFSTRATQLEDELYAARKAKRASKEELQAIEETWRATLREAREAEAKAVTIENAVYDLKAVNPNRRRDEDTRTPADIIAAIEDAEDQFNLAMKRLKTSISITAEKQSLPSAASR
jgi:type I restriction enzyme M protein